MNKEITKFCSTIVVALLVNLGFWGVVFYLIWELIQKL